MLVPLLTVNILYCFAMITVTTINCKLVSWMDIAYLSVNIVMQENWPENKSFISSQGQWHKMWLSSRLM